MTRAVRLRAAVVMLATALAGERGAAHAQTAPAAVAPRATVERIGALLERNDLPGANAVVTSALADWPADPALHNFAGVVAAQRGETASAETHFLTAIRLAPHAAAPYTNLGRLYQERSAADPAARTKAVDVYRRLLAIEPSHREALFQAGRLLALDGRFGDSLALLERLPGDVRAGPQVMAVIAVDREGTGDTAGAMRDINALGADPRLAEADVMAVQPAFAHLRDDRLPQALLAALDARGLASPGARQELAGIHMRHGRLADARAVLERAAGATAGSPASASVLVDLARVTARQGDPKGALGYLAHARTLEPQNPRIHFLFGIVCVQLDLGREAYDSLKRAVELDPDNALVNYAMGAVAMHRHDPSESIPWFERYVRLAPNDPRGRFALGAARYYSNQPDAARRDLESAAASPQTAAGAHYFLARLARQADDLVTARREIDLALAGAPSHADAWAERGLIETRAGKYADAERALAKALALDPENYDATRHLAALYGRTRDPRRAEQEARLASLIEKREARMQDFLRLVEAVP
jgi:tetratricopeptide (TPR) repeat protein